MITKQDWLDASLDALMERGASQVKVERLARALGVTKGSFYWHFEDRQDLLRQTADYWAEKQHAYLAALKAEAHGSPEDRLKGLLAYIDGKDIRHDVAMRMWAHREDWVRALLAELDRLRLDYCESIFCAMGFPPLEARLRAHLVYYYQIAEQTISFQEPEEVRARLAPLRIDLLTGKS